MRSRSALLVFVTAVAFVADLTAAGRRPPIKETQGKLALSPLSYTPHVEKLADRYRLTVETPDPLPHYLIEKSSKKVWLRLVRPSLEESQILEGDSVIREVRLVQRAYSADMILKLGDDAIANDVYFDEGKKKIVVDVFTSERISKQIASAVSTTETPVLKTKKSVFKNKPTPKIVAPVITTAQPVIRTAPSKSNIVRTIVIDAGHGGMDSGAIGARGTLEKDINLDFAQDLAKLIGKDKNFRIIMTRDSDIFIPLEQRTKIANEAGADLFISIHCNASLSSKNTGFETYFLSPDATDKAAASVARLENSVVALEANKGAPSSRLSELLASMAVGNFINESSKFASLICRNIRLHTSEDSATVKEADFFVLRGAQMPAVLVELQYLSNPITENKLRSSRYRSQLVKGVTEGIKAYDQQAKQERETVKTQLSGQVNTNSTR